MRLRRRDRRRAGSGTTGRMGMGQPEIAQEHIIVTGGASGIGASVVEDLTGRGALVTVLDLQQAVSEERPATVDYMRVDVTDEPAVQTAVARARQRGGQVTGLVTCHGIRGSFLPALDLDFARTRNVLDVHVLGTLAVSREVVRGLEGAPASIVTVSSTTAFGGWEKQSDYGVAKAAVRQLTENLAIEWAPLGVRVNSVAPGHTLTPMVQEMIDGGYDPGAVFARTPLGRFATPGEMAASIVFLLLDATFVTGQCLAVDGGWTVVGK
ncbi:SDR family oxidoreductase [Arthrobacter sp. APC 3897]|uniref:SDR family NAD(P)-dependent oxidoreductase n=1 Tax=Arthrobacter sp. APC 3897 TaxID=3035204 RepID=UPI0025B3AB9C|nr:SDR family oxidoreductase [Arthrobacter sp. APC 3897]MDN3481176.1 SDR family oxidoreductase [Arthrobacter sp. APC 3897]